MRERALLLISIACVAFAIALPDLSTIAGQPPAPTPDPLYRDAVPAPPRGLSLDGAIVRVIDGDTVIVSTEMIFRVRLLDCWAPESRTTDAAEKTRGIAAKDRLTELAAGRPVRVFVPTDSAREVSDVITLGRVLGRVWLLDESGVPSPADLSAVMVAEGHATKRKSD